MDFMNKTIINLEIDLEYINNIVIYVNDTLKLLNSLKILITWRVERRPTALPIMTPHLEFDDLQCVTVNLK